MVRTERHIVINNKNIDELCFLSKNLYNYTNYILRQVFTEKFENLDDGIKSLIKTFVWKDKTYYTIPEFSLITYLTKIKQVDYKALPSQSAQQVIRLLYRNWKSFYKSIKSYLKNKDSFNGSPKIPKYKNKNGRTQLK